MIISVGVMSARHQKKINTFFSASIVDVHFSAFSLDLLITNQGTARLGIGFSAMPPPGWSTFSATPDDATGFGVTLPR